MVDRGGCTFVQKVRNAQRSGAAGVIIADNTCLCSAGDSCHSDPGTDCETREPIMADDGSGADISIPSFLMFKQDADPIKAEVMAKQALAAYTVLGFDAVRLPFCQTFEAVALGCIRKPGKVRELEGFPGIEHPPPYKLDDTPEFCNADSVHQGRFKPF